MIAITDLQGKEHYINAELIECVESTPDTQIVLTTGRHIYVSQTPEEITGLVIEYKRECRRLPENGD